VFFPFIWEVFIEWSIIGLKINIIIRINKNIDIVKITKPEAGLNCGNLNTQWALLINS